MEEDTALGEAGRRPQVTEQPAADPGPVRGPPLSPPRSPPPRGLGKQQGHPDTGSSLLSPHLPGTQSALSKHSLNDAKHWDPFLRSIISRTGQQSRVRTGDTFHK